MKIEMNQSELESAIVNKAVDEILGGCDDIHALITNVTKSRIDAAIGKRLNTAIEETLNAIIERSLDSEINPINTWGEREGKPTTVRAALHERAEFFWSENVDSNGKKASYGGSPRYQHVLSIITAAEFDSAVKQNIVNIAGAVKDAVRKDFYSAVDSNLNKFFKINSASDQQRKRDQ